MKSISDIKLESATALVLSDIHSNLPAMKGALALRFNNEPVIFAGDAVGYYAEPNECCDLLREVGAICVRGNHEAYVLGDLAPNTSNAQKYRLEWTKEKLRPDNLEWIKSLPQTVRITARSLFIMLRHANPFDEETYLYPDTDLGPYSQPPDQLLIVGHTHHPMLRKAGGGRILNPGSVGQPRDHLSPHPSLARVALDSGRVEFVRADYDVAEYQAKLLANGWRADTVGMLHKL